jgi:hypothetical protein
MKKVLFLLAVLAVLVTAPLISRPPTANQAPASDLQMVVSGDDSQAMAVGKFRSKTHSGCFGGNYTCPN